MGDRIETLEVVIVIEATLKGKIPKEVAESEDCLTSTVWGLLKYRPLRPVLARFLSGASLYSDESRHLDSVIPSRCFLRHDLVFKFWPSWPDYGEPDLLLVGSEFALVIEVKYGAKISGPDQLKRYDALLQHEYPGKAHKPIVYLTDDLSAPDLNSEATFGLEDSLWWLSWHDLSAAIRDLCDDQRVDEEMAKDLLRYLDHHNLGQYHGISLLSSDRVEVLFWEDVIPMISRYAVEPAHNRYFWKGARS